MKIKSKLFIAGILLCLIFIIIYFYPRIINYYTRYDVDRKNQQVLNELLKDTTRVIIPDTVTEQISIAIMPEKAYLIVPFFCQAPYQNQASWDLHHASCEEAALLQAVYYDKKIDSINLKTIDRTLLDMIAWQKKHFGIHKDIHADSVKMLMTGYFGYTEDQIHIIRKATIDDIKREVASGYPVIAPTYGRTLNNPYYTPPGPEYHMVTVIGYTKDRIITNDVGTKRGKDFTYDIPLFMKSMYQEGGDVLVIRPSVTHPVSSAGK
jgi:hypothetical protein